MTEGTGKLDRTWRSCLYFVGLFYLFTKTSAQIRYSIQEELKVGSSVGNLAKDLGLDLETVRRFRIVSGSKDGLFQVNQNNGILRVQRNIDREELCDSNSECLVNLKIVVENPLELHYVGVEITDVNDHAPSFQEKEKRLEIAENRLAGARFQLQAARDPDIGTNTVRSYKISQNEHFDLQVREREQEKIPYLVLQKPLDRETRSVHRLVLTALDGGNPPKSGTLNVTISVLDSNDNPPIFSKELYSVTIPENVDLGTVVLKVKATDIDEGPNGEIEYVFGPDLDPIIRNIFALDSITGEIQVKAPLDFEDREVFKVDVQAMDKGQPPFTVECGVIIKILDVNDNTPDIEVTSLFNVVSEDSKPGTVIALISVLDKDSGVNGKVTCSVPADVPFELKSSVQDNMYSLVTKGHLDRETTARYDVTITASDFGQPPLSASKTLSVQVADVNDNRPEFRQNQLEFYLPENNAPGASVFSVSSSDLDLNENAAVSYQIVRGHGAQDELASFLNVNSENGVISALKSFDFEKVKTFKFQVRAVDSGSPPLSTNVTVTVFILDQNDNPPVILSPTNANGSAEGVEEIPRNVNAGHLVTKVRAYDRDVGYNGWLLFSLQYITDHTLFGLDRYTGQIRTLRSFTETDDAEHKMVITVKDNGNVSLSATATVIIKAVEPKEAFASADVKSTQEDGEENHMTFYLVITLGTVSVLFIISIVVLIAMQCSKSPDCSSNSLSFNSSHGFWCYLHLACDVRIFSLQLLTFSSSPFRAHAKNE
uniref:Cadherin domain-containing protein n=1 Tax=Denticeps clupeoides TaxID=299321 RepID=A0AAY4DKW2_9TELE